MRNCSRHVPAHGCVPMDDTSWYMNLYMNKELAVQMCTHVHLTDSCDLHSVYVGVT